jgi:hypothetical protein
MGEWLGIAALYVLGIGFFRWLGGIGAAADAIQRWGQASARARRRATPSSR